jgi:hypothetical protein
LRGSGKVYASRGGVTNGLTRRAAYH